MQLKRLQRIGTVERTQNVFLGYRNAERVAEGEWCRMQNLTSDHYPVLATRPSRGQYARAAAFGGMFRYDTLCYVDGPSVVVNGYACDIGLTTDQTPKKLTRMGAYLIILPDKKYLNLTNLTDHGPIEAHVSVTGTARLVPCRADGSSYDQLLASATRPSETDTVWLDTSLTPPVLREYSAATGDFSAMPTCYLRVDAPGIGAPFLAGDGVCFSGLGEALDGTHVLAAAGKDYLVITGLVSVPTTVTGLSVSRTMPDMDFMIEAGNRLWGCRYGVSATGGIVNELYACALGDFRNWHCFAGLSTDSYAVGVGSDGPFTGAVTYLGQPLFFKEHFMHRVYGAYPAAFQVTGTPCRGVKPGCAQSLAIVEETLFYLSEGGVCAFDGSLPTLVSEALGATRYADAAAGARGSKYYVSMRDTATNGWNFFAFDTKKGLWHREDALHATAFCACGGELYAADAAGRILTVGGTGAAAEGALPFFAESGPVGLDDPCHRYLSRLHIRMSLSRGARVRVLLQYDSQGEFEEVFSTRCRTFRGITAVIRPRRCDHFRLRLEGEGDVRVFSITRFEEKGGA